MGKSEPNFFRYVPIRPQDVDWGLYVTGAGRTHSAPGDAYPSERHPTLYDYQWKQGRQLPEFQIIYVVRGEGQFESTSTGQVKVFPGTIILLFPDVWHRYRPSQETGWDEHWVGFNGTWAEQLLRHGFFSPQHAVLQTGISRSLLRPFKMINQLLESERFGLPQILAAYTMEILAAVIALAPPEDGYSISRGPRQVSPVEDRLVADAIRAIWEHTGGPLSVDTLIQQLPTSRRSLERRFQSELSHSIAEEITKCKLERAIGLLEKTQLPIKQIAAKVGFASADTMGRVFQRVFQQSPRQYRFASQGLGGEKTKDPI